MNLGELVAAETSILEPLLASDNAVPDAIVEATVILSIYEALGAEPADLAGEPGGELGGIEPVDGANPTLAIEKLVVIFIDVISEHGDQARARDHDPLLGILLAFRRRDDGLGGRCIDGEAAPGEEEMGGVLLTNWAERRGMQGRGLKSLHACPREKA